MREFWNRRELYNLVWAEPMTKVAEKFGVSDVAIAKACRKLKVPVPGRGYWAKKANGHRVSQTPFRDLKSVPGVAKPHPGRKKEAVDPRDQLHVDGIDRLLATGALAPRDVEQAMQHPFVVRTAKEAKKATEDSRHLLRLPPGCFDMDVTKGSVDRALRLMATIIAVCESNGIKLAVGEGGTHIEHLGERVAFGIKEKVKQFALPPGTRGKYDYGPTFAGKPVDFAPTGALSLEIHAYTELRKNWNDTERRKLEDVIPEFVATLLRSAVELHRRTENRRQEELERQRLAAEREELRKQCSAEKQRLHDLLDMSENWQRAHTIRNFLQACKAAAAQADSSQPREEFDRWYKWAEAQANWLDPLTQSPPSILDRMDELL